MPISKQFVLEICVESIDLAVEAERGGAHRIELCSQLSLEGLTPTIDVIQQARKQISIPIHVMIRPRDGDFCYGDREFARMEDEILAAKRLAMDGIVLGILSPNRTVDVARTRKLVELAHPLPVTFHRAFDQTADLFQALEDVICAGAKRILTSGGRERAVSGLRALEKLTARAGNRIIIMPGGGINERNVRRIARAVALRELHCSLREHIPATHLRPAGVFEQKVRKLFELIANGNGGSPPARPSPVHDCG
jgi:copper homeostasis protein